MPSKPSNAQQHLKLLETPQRERDKQWFNQVNALLVELECTCSQCHTHFVKKVFKDEVDNEPKEQYCIICQDENPQTSQQ